MNGLRGEDGLVQIDDTVVVTNEMRDLTHQIQSPLLILNILSRIDQLCLLHLLPLDLMECVELTKKSWIDVVVTKMAMEEEASSLKRFTCPKLESLRITKKVYVFLFEESKAVAFTNWHCI